MARGASILGLLLSAGLSGQPSASGPRFEVASVKPVRDWPPPGSLSRERGTGGGCPTSLKIDRARVEIRCANLAMLIGYAYRFSPDRVTGPDWMMALGSPRFELAATIPQGASPKQVPEMLQSLLAGRFHLVIHRGSANRAIYALVVAKGGLKMKQAGAETAAEEQPVEAPAATGEFFGAVQTRTIQNPDGSEATTLSSPAMGTVRQTGGPFRLRWEASGISAAGLAELIDKVAPLPTPIVDRTGLSRRYRMTLEVDLTAARPGGSDSIADLEPNVVRAFNDGLQKLGLRLEHGKGPIETIVVDRVEKTPTEN